MKFTTVHTFSVFIEATELISQSFSLPIHQIKPEITFLFPVFIHFSAILRRTPKSVQGLFSFLKLEIKAPISENYGGFFCDKHIFPLGMGLT